MRTQMQLAYTLRNPEPTAICCLKCNKHHREIDTLPLWSIGKVLEESWRPITLECTCGARCTILNGHICEEAKR